MLLVDDIGHVADILPRNVCVENNFDSEAVLSLRHKRDEDNLVVLMDPVCLLLLTNNFRFRHDLSLFPLDGILLQDGSPSLTC